MIDRSRLVAELAKRGWAVDTLVQRSRPPAQNDRVVYYGYCGSVLRCIVTEHRAPGDQQQELRDLREEVACAVRIRQRMTPGELRASILVPEIHVGSVGEVLQIAEYVRPRHWFARGRRRLRDYAHSLAASSRWLRRFQEETAEAGPDRSEIHAYFSDRVKRYCVEHDRYLPSAFAGAASALVSILESGSSLGPVSACHGDYCYWNYFGDGQSQFRVYDWETARMRDYAVRDFFSDIITYALTARSSGLWDGGFDDLIRTGDNPSNPMARLLSRTVREYSLQHDLSEDTMRVGLVYAYVCLVLRITSPQTIQRRTVLISEFTSLLP